MQGPLGDHYLSTVGPARSEDDRFTPKLDSSGHGYRLRFRPDRGLEAGIVGRVSFRRDKESGRRNPYPRELEQIVGGVSAYLGRKKPLIFSRGDYVKLCGALLSFDARNEELGVFLVRLRGSEGYRCGPYASVKPSMVIFGMAADALAGL